MILTVFKMAVFKLKKVYNFKKLNKDSNLILNGNHIKPIKTLTKQNKFNISNISYRHLFP